MPPVHGPNDDTLTALIVFAMLEEQNKSPDECMGLKDEIAKLQASLRGYKPRVTDDPLGWGLEVLFDQFVLGNPRKKKLLQLAPEALHPMHLGLPFRLYGALIGAMVVPSSAIGDTGVSAEYIHEVLQSCVNYQFRIIKEQSDREEHRSINRVMLAMALLSPGVLLRRHSDPIIQL